MENNLESTVAQAMGISGTESVEATSTQADTEPKQESTATVEPEIAQPAVKVEDSNSTIKQMREQIASQKASNKELEEKLQRIADANGKSVDDLLAEIQEKEDRKKAESLGVSPEVAAQLRQQEARIKELEELSVREDFNNRVVNFSKEYKLSDADLKQFYTDAVNNGFDLLRKGLDLSVVYRAINFERLSAEKEASIRQQILNEMQQQRENANGVSSLQNQSSLSKTTDNTSDADFITSLKESLNK